MSIELNKQYRTRSGLPVRIYSIDGGGMYTVHGAYLADNDCYEWLVESWTNAGKVLTSRDENNLDLVEIQPEPTYRPFTPDELPRIVGRRVRYKAITGRIREIIAIDGMYVVMPISGSCETDDFLEHWQFLDYDSDGNEVVTPCGGDGGAMTDYPIWICRECGDKYGRRPVGIASWHVGDCGVCGNRSWVTEPRDFGHLTDVWWNREQKKGGE